MRITRSTAIRACRYDDPLRCEIIRYAGDDAKVVTIDGYIILTCGRGLIKPWIKNNLERLASFGIKGEIIILGE